MIPPSWLGASIPLALKHPPQNHHVGNDRCCAGRSMVAWLGYLHLLGRVDSLIAGDCCDHYHLSSSQWEKGNLNRWEVNGIALTADSRVKAIPDL